MNVEEVQPLVIQQLQKSLVHHTVSHAYLFEGGKGTGKKAVALWLAQALFCLNPNDGKPCGTCHNCIRIKEENHPDVSQIMAEGQRIKIDQIRELKESLTKSGLETKQKVLILHDADKMTVNAANGLLKFLEEPDGQVVIILLTTQKSAILPTIQSRCQTLTFKPLAKQQLIERLVAEGISENTADLLSQLTNSWQKAVELSQDEWFNEARDNLSQWYQYLIQKDALAFIYVQKQLIRTFKEKEQQNLLFDLLLIRYRNHLFESLAKKSQSEEIKKLEHSMEFILQARLKYTSNVSFQNVCEQLAWKILQV